MSSYGANDPPKLYQDEILYGNSFFLSERRREETRTVFTIVRMLSDFGGFYIPVMGVLGSLAKFINT